MHIPIMQSVNRILCKLWPGISISTRVIKFHQHMFVSTGDRGAVLKCLIFAGCDESVVLKSVCEVLIFTPNRLDKA